MKNRGWDTPRVGPSEVPTPGTPYDLERETRGRGSVYVRSKSDNEDWYRKGTSILRPLTLLQFTLHFYTGLRYFM